MPTIIDALLITLSLDPTQFVKGKDTASRAVQKLKDDIREAEDEIHEIQQRSTKATQAEDAEKIKVLKDRVYRRKREAEDLARNSKDEEAQQKRSADGIGKVRQAALELFAVFTAGKDIKTFFQDLIVGDASTGRLAKNLGVATETLGAYEAIVKRLGGTPGEADQGLQSIVTAFEDMKFTGRSDQAPFLQALGINSIEQLNDVPGTLKTIGAHLRAMNAPDAQYKGQRAGLPSGLINALRSDTLDGDINDAIKRGVPTQESARRAQAIVTTFNDMKQASTELGREIFITLAPALMAGLRGLLGIAEWATKHSNTVMFAFDALIGVVVGLGVALAPEVLLVAAFTGAIVGLAAAVGFLVDKFKQLSTIHIDKKGNVTWDKPTAPPTSSAYTGGTETLGGLMGSHGASGGVIQGVLAGIYAEGGGLGMAANGAFGIGQWRGPRLRALMARYGPNPTLKQQQQFLMWELMGGDPGGRSVLNSGSALEAGTNYITKFMRPGNGTAGDLARMSNYLSKHGASRTASNSTSNSVQVGTVNVHTQATDANGVAKGLAGAMQKYTYVAQGTSGLG